MGLTEIAQRPISVSNTVHPAMTRCYRRGYGGTMLLTTVRGRVGRLLQRPASGDAARHRPVVDRATALEDEFRAVADADLAATVTKAFDGKDHDLARFCAAAREAARRALDVRVFDEQLMGTLSLLQERVVQMATGEGKTLCGALAAAGFAAQGRRIHVLTVNDYLARRDRDWMRPVYELLGASADWVEPAHTPERRREAYRAQVVYGAVSEIGFDVLRDRLVTDAADRVAPTLDVAIVDEVDSVLVDEARVPLVLAGSVPGEQVDAEVMAVARTLRKGVDYRVDAERRNVSLTTHGARVVEKGLGGIDLYTTQHGATLASVNVALHALVLLRRDVDYIVRKDKVQLINASRGRVAELQRWPDGIQAAVEAKEGIAASSTGEVLDSITVGNFVRRYRTVAGMTGTAVDVAEELREFHELEVDVVATHEKCVREDLPDRLFDTGGQRLTAVVEQIESTHATGRPVLVGTPSVAASEELEKALRDKGLEPALLNARNDAEEARIIAKAGEPGHITVSTQMAGRGTDIRLGEGVARLGGLSVLGFARHESSRLDDQLRGRCGRQGDPGSTEFFVALDDEVVTKYGADIPDTATDPQAGPVIDRAQRIAQADNLSIHRTTWNYHHLVDQQRDRVLNHREEVLTGEVAADDLRRRCPERWRQLAGELDTGDVEHCARLIRLYHLDRRWSEHLGFLTELRDGIHLRGLARGLAAQSPLHEFHQEAMSAIRSFTADVDKDTVETFETIKVENGKIDLDTSLKRPSSTWTYLITDTPFGSEADRAMEGLAKIAGGTSPIPKVAIVIGGILLVLAFVFLLYIGL
jgi:preprotein translocase subunit SecA